MGNYLKLSNRYLLEYLVNGNKGIIKYSDLKKYYEYATKDDCEYINANICDDKIVICFTVAQGQGGVVAVWDTESKKFTHVSDGEYAVTATIYKNKIYILENVSNFVEKSHSLISCVEYGIIDSAVESNFIQNIDDSIDLNSDVVFEVKNDGILINDVIIDI